MAIDDIGHIERMQMRPVKSGGTGIGCRKKAPNRAKQPLKKAGKPLRRVSGKQRKRNAVLKEKLEMLLWLQKKLYGYTRCEAGMVGWCHCGGSGTPLVLDHVHTRQEGDGYENLEILCWSANSRKGSMRLDFRPVEMKRLCEQLEREENEKND